MVWITPQPLIGSDSTERNSIESPLLRLPAELRNPVYRAALDTAVIFVGYEIARPPRLRRKGLYLPRVCRQTRHEIASLVDGYTKLHLEGSWKWARVRSFQSALIRQSQSFSAVRELHLPVEKAVLISQYIEGLAVHGLPQQLSGKLLQNIFSSLERIVLYVKDQGNIDAHIFRHWLGKPELEIVYAG